MTVRPELRINHIPDCTVFWAGEFPPNTSFVHSSNIYSPAFDFRQEPHFHGGFDHVFLVERDLGSLKQWPMILDEAIRLLRRGSEGKLTIRTSHHGLVEPHTIAAFLRLRHDTTFEPVAAEQGGDAHATLTLRCFRQLTRPQLDSFEFSVITNGGRSERLAEFVTSVNNIVGIDDITAGIAICGPASVVAELPQSRIPIRFVPPPNEFKEKAWITGKKNRIVETAEAENLVIVHDRYAIPPEFLQRMFEFGADFDVLNPTQIDRKGMRVGDWVSTGSRFSTGSVSLLDYDDFDPNVFVSGGAIIAKREALLAVPWNEMLFWGQAEDVELSRAHVNMGYTPRLGRRVQLLVTDSRPGLRESFTPLQMLPNSYAGRPPTGRAPEPVVGPARLGRSISLLNASNVGVSLDGVAYPHGHWSAAQEGLLPRAAVSDLNIVFDEVLTEELHLALFLRSPIPPTLILYANGIEIPVSVRPFDASGWRVEGTIPRESLTFAQNDPLANSRTLHLGFECKTPWLLRTLRVDRKTPVASYPIQLSALAGPGLRLLGPGWGEVEPWGIWSVGNTADLNLPVPSGWSDRDLLVVCTANALARREGDNLVVGALCNGFPVASMVLPSHGRTSSFQVRIPGPLINEHRELLFRFRIANPISPRALGRGSDNRPLGIGLQTLEVRDPAASRRPRPFIRGRSASVDDLNVYS